MENAAGVAARPINLLDGLLDEAGHELRHDRGRQFRGVGAEEGQADGLYAGEGGLAHPGAHVTPAVQRVVLQGEEEGVVHVEDHLEAEAGA